MDFRYCLIGILLAWTSTPDHDTRTISWDYYENIPGNWGSLVFILPVVPVQPIRMSQGQPVYPPEVEESVWCQLRRYDIFFVHID